MYSSQNPFFGGRRGLSPSANTGGPTGPNWRYYEGPGKTPGKGVRGIKNFNYPRFGIGSVAGIIGLNSAGRAWESAKYGEWGTAAAYGALAAGAGYVSYNSFMNTPTYARGASMGANLLMKNAGKVPNTKISGAIKTIANAIRNVR
jgi:hypothetical protein